MYLDVYHYQWSKDYCTYAFSYYLIVKHVYTYVSINFDCHSLVICIGIKYYINSRSASNCLAASCVCMLAQVHKAAWYMHRIKFTLLVD